MFSLARELHDYLIYIFALISAGLSLALFQGLRIRAELRRSRQRENEHLRQKELLHHIISNVPNHVFWKDRNSRYLGCNEQFARTAGLKCAADIVGMTDFDLPWTREEAEGYRRIDNEVMTHGRAISNLEESQRTADGSKTTVVTSKVPLHDSQGEVYGVLGVYMDITERKNLETSMRTRLAAIDAAAEMVVITDATGIIEYVNPAFVTSTGYQIHELLGKTLSAVKSGKNPPSLYANLWKTILSGKVWRGELMNRRKDGTVFPEEMSVTPVLDDQGNVIQFVAIKHDITKRREREAMERERTRLFEAVSGMEQVLGVVGHELRTPLAGLRAMSEFLLDEKTRDMPEFETFLLSIHNEVVRMTDTVNNLLEAARLNSGRAYWNWGTVDLNQVCREAIETTRPLIDASAVELCPPEDSEQCIMQGDESAIRRMLINLLTNARKHTPAGSISIQFQRVEDDGHQWVDVTVADTGAGIPPEIADRLGDAFALNSGTVGANHIAGTGLGLAICKGIVAAHGGNITVHSVADLGTTICARLRTDLDHAVENAGPGKLVAHAA